MLLMQIGCVLSLIHSPVKEGVYYLSTVGDDNALAVLILTLPAANSLQTTCLKVLCIERNAHASSITGKLTIRQ